MPPATRRSFLAATLLASTGCVGFTDNDSRLCDVGIVNQYDEPVEVVLRIREDNELLVEETATLDPPAEGERHGDALFVQDEQLPTETGQYIVQMRVADDDWETVDTTEYNEPLLILGTITVLDDPGSPSLTIDANHAEC